MSESEGQQTLRSALRKSPSAPMTPSTPGPVTRSQESPESYASAYSSPNNSPPYSRKMHAAGPSLPHSSNRRTHGQSESQPPLSHPHSLSPTHQSDNERFSSRWDSEDYSKSRGTQSDGQPSNPRSISSRPSAAARGSSSSRLRSLNTASTNSFAPPPPNSFFTSRSPSSPTTRRDGTPMPPLPPNPPPSSVLPSPPSRQLGRARSESLLGMAASVSRDRDKGQKPPDAQHQHTHDRSSSPNTPIPQPVFTVLVIGSPQCGKSTLIAKGLKQSSLTRERPVVLGGSLDSPSGTSREIRATSRVAQVAGRSAPNPIELLEVSSTELLACRDLWPHVIAQSGVVGSPTANTLRGRVIDGLVVCYNIVDKESWNIAKSLLAHASTGYALQRIQAIVVACKTDLLDVPVPHDPSHYHPILSKHSADVDVFRIGVYQDLGERSSTDGTVPAHQNLGLVPVAHTEGRGRKKMADSFNWLFRRLDRSRKENRSNGGPLDSTPLSNPAENHPTTSGRPGVDPASHPTLPSASLPLPTSLSPPTNTLEPFHHVPESALPSSTRPPSISKPLSAPVITRLQLPSINEPPPPSVSSPRTPSSASRARSTSDLAFEVMKAKEKERDQQEREYAGLRAAGILGAGQSIVGPPSASGRSVTDAGSVVGNGANGTSRHNASASDLRSRSSASVAGETLGDEPAAGTVNGRPPPEEERNDTPVSTVIDHNFFARGPNITVSMLPARSVKEPPPMQFATFDELLDKLFFVSVTDDDTMFVEQFLLIYRAFATPRSLLLGIQKRLRSLTRDAVDDILLAKFAQMRICALLDKWITNEPGDLAAVGAEPAFAALLNNILQYTHLAHYASELFPFLDVVSQLTDVETAWALPESTRRYKGGDGEGSHEGEDESDEVGNEALGVVAASVSIAVTPDADDSTDGGDHATLVSNGGGAMPGAASPSRGPSMSSSHPSTLVGTLNIANFYPRFDSRQTPLGPWAPAGTRASMKELLKVSAAIANIDPARIAEEITRIEVPLFLAVESRDWLRATIGRRKATKAGKTIEQAMEVTPKALKDMARFYNYLANWTASVILVHDRPRARAKIMEKMMGVARALRALNNYSGLRAVVSGINMTRKEKDPVTEIMSVRPAWKAFQSLEVLLGTTRMHSAYRMALKHTVGPAIPSMEVHTYDLVRADDTNCDFKPGDSELVHWGKFSLMAKMVITVSHYQERFQDSTALEFPENREVNDLLMKVVVMDEETMIKRSDPSFFGSGLSTLTAESSTARFKSIFRRP